MNYNVLAHLIGLILLVVVSHMMKISISLNNDIQCEYICRQIQKLITKFQESNKDISHSLIVINIVQTTDGGDGHIPKLEYKPPIVSP